MTARSGMIGIFDSGVGGLTVVRALLRRFPHARVLYTADQAHVPYGGRPLDEVQGFACGISAFLAGQGCEIVVMACNISSATALSSVRAALAPHPVLGVIAPAARRAAAARSATSQDKRLDRSPRIGVLATEGTVLSGAYTKHIRQINPEAFIREFACPQFVPLVEAGAFETPEAYAAARKYLAPLAADNCDRIILGCTHYPFLLPTLRKVACGLFPHPVTFIDPADEMGEALSAAVPNLDTLRPEMENTLLTSGDVGAFRNQALHFLPDVPFNIGSVHWTTNGLQ